MNLVWLKRDLRIQDHQPIVEAAKNGEILLLYIYEPEVVLQPDFDAIHLRFINESLIELRAKVEALGGKLLVTKGQAIRVFEQMRTRFGMTHLWSHREVGNMLTFKRDIEVAQWANSVGVLWTEYSQNGVIRKLKTRDGWAQRWLRKMNEQCLAAPSKLTSPIVKESGEILEAKDIGIEPRCIDLAQRGGEDEGRKTLESFLEYRGQHYRKLMSSPLTAFDACGRVSPYISWGCLSVRQVYQAANDTLTAVRAKEKSGRGWVGSLKSFLSRLSWHCHFMQKLEDQPNIDEVNISRAFDGLRDGSWNEEYFQAWRQGRTGYPILDACMRSLRDTGYLNFRMRAMVMSFASYHLWLHWRKTGEVLARYFLDYEPGIHWSQVQMQSGTTGINTIRVYSPPKQSVDQDPEGIFIKRWVPELAEVPIAYIHEPHLMPEMEQMFCGCIIGQDYPEPIVSHKIAYREAQERVHEVKKTELARLEALEIYQKHGSRKRRRE